MGRCKQCGKEVIGEGYCPSCASNIENDRMWDNWIGQLLHFMWHYIFKPLIPPAIVLTIFQYIGFAVLEATGSKILMALIQYIGIAVTSLIFGYLYKKNIYKGLSGSYWNKVFIYYTGLLFFIAGASIFGIIQGTQKAPVQTMILGLFYIILAIGHIVWMFVARKNYGGGYPNTAE